MFSGCKGDIAFFYFGNSMHNQVVCNIRIKINGIRIALIINGMHEIVNHFACGLVIKSHCYICFSRFT